MSGSTTTNAQDVIFLDSLYRDSLNIGSVLASDDNGVFQHVAPSANNQALVSNLSNPNGVEWASYVSTGCGIPSFTAIRTPGTGSSVYFLSAGSVNDVKSLILPPVQILSFTITPSRGVGSVDGWSTTPTNITGGFLDFYYCYIPLNTQNIPANVQYLSTLSGVPPVPPDFQIAGTGINSAGTNYTSFLHNMINLESATDSQIFIQMVNNLTTSSNPVFHSFQCFTIFKTI